MGDSIGLSNSMQKVVGDERAEELDRAIDKLRADKEAATLRAAESKKKAKESAKASKKDATKKEKEDKKGKKSAGAPPSK